MRRLKNRYNSSPVKTHIVVISWLLAILSILVMVMSFTVANLNRKVNRLQASSEVIKVQRACNEYSIKEFRAGEAPEKCATEIYGDQF